MRRTLQLVAVVAVLSLVGHRVALFIAFPIGGGEFHALFAYWQPPDACRADLWRAWLAGTGALVLIAGVATWRVAAHRMAWLVGLGPIAIGLQWWARILAWQQPDRSRWLNPGPQHDWALTEWLAVPLVGTIVLATALGYACGRRGAGQRSGELLPTDAAAG